MKVKVLKFLPEKWISISKRALSFSLYYVLLTDCLDVEVKPHPCEEKGEEGDEEDSPGAASRRLLATTTTTSDYHPPAYGQEGRPVEGVNEGSGGNSGSGDSSSVISGSVVGSAAGGDGLLWRTDYVRCARCEDMQVGY